jgi:hypothetical protein
MDTNFCEIQVINTGEPDCDIQFGKIEALIFGSKSVVITPTDLNDLLSFFQEKAIADNYNDRVLPVTGMKQVEPSYTAPTFGSLTGYGYSEKQSDGSLGDNVQFPLSLCRAKSMFGLDGYNGRVFVLLDNGILIGTRTAEGNLIGLPLESVSTQLPNGTWRNGSSIPVVQLGLVFGSDKKVISNMGAVKYDFDTDELDGLQNLTLSKVDTLEYKVQTECDSIDLYDTYKVKLANPELWIVTNTLTGATLTVSNVSADDSNKTFKLTVDKLNAPYKINVRLASVSKLTAEGIEGFEQPRVLIDKQS